MRDDVHKGLPVPKRWKRLVEACTRDADWAERGPGLAAAAAAATLRAGVRPALFVQVGEILRDPGLFGVAGRLDELVDAGEPSAMERSLVQAAIAACERGLAGRTAFSRAIEDQLGYEQQSHLRAIAAQVYLRDPIGAPELIRRLQIAAARADMVSAARAIEQGAPLARLVPAQRPLDLDENLVGDPLRSETNE